MGNWSDYFEDFPEENDANYIYGRYYAPGSQEANNVAHRRRFAQVNAEKVAQEQAALNAEIRAIIKNIRNRNDIFIRHPNYLRRH